MFIIENVENMSKVSYYTEEGLKKLRAELNHLKDIERPKASQAIAEARDKGDLSENAEYDAAKEALMAEFQSYSAMYAHNHSDQIRQSNGLEELSFEAEGLDWSTSKVVVVSTYDTKWGANRAFFDGIKNGSLKTLKESGHAVAAYAK